MRITGEDKMDTHIIFFDIDGTLIDEETDAVPASAGEALRRAKVQGHHLFVCSGRCKAIMPDNVLELGFDGLIGGCGTYIEMGGAEIYHHTLSEQLQKEVIEDLQRYHIDGVLEGRDCSSFRRDYWMPVVKRIFTENGTFMAKTQCFWDEEFSFDKMALWFDESSDMGQFQAKYEDVFDFIRRDSTFYEVIPKGISKATGMEFVCEKLGIPRENTVAFGDSTNDISMLAFAGTSVAMGSGNPILFEKVDLVTDAVLEDGIANAMKHLKLIKD